MSDPYFPANIREDVNGTVGHNIENRDPGSAAACEYRLYNGGPGRAASVFHGVNFTYSGPARADGRMDDCGGAGGYTWAITNASAKFYWWHAEIGDVGEMDGGKCYFKLPLHFKPGSSVTPANIGDVTAELTNNTTLTFKAKGSDGVVRPFTLRADGT